jgi:uncharacterized protein (TIGR00369 family)
MSEESIPDGAVDAIQHYFDTQHEFLSWLSVEVEELEYGRAVMTIPYQRKLTNVPWTGGDEEDRHPIQGGVASTLVDTVGGIAMRGHLTDPVNDGVATINLNVNYLQQATDDLRATAEVIRAGNTVGVADVLVESTHEGETVPVAIGQGAYRLFKS